MKTATKSLSRRQVKKCRRELRITHPEVIRYLAEKREQARKAPEAPEAPEARDTGDAPARDAVPAPVDNAPTDKPPDAASPKRAKKKKD